MNKKNNVNYLEKELSFYYQMVILFLIDMIGCKPLMYVPALLVFIIISKHQWDSFGVIRI